MASKSPSAGPTAGESTPTDSLSGLSPVAATGGPNLLSQAFTEESVIGSPLKKQRASNDDAARGRPTGFPAAMADVLSRAAGQTTAPAADQSGAIFGPKDDTDEEL